MRASQPSATPPSLISSASRSLGELARSRLMPTINVWAPNWKLVRAASALLRRFAPILVVGKRVVVSRHADVLEVLTRDTDFTIAEVNARRFDELQGRFILGMDRSPEYERDAAILRRVVPPEDLGRIRRFVVETAAALVDARRAQGRIEVVGDLARRAPARLIASYFGVPGPDEETLVSWMRALFYHAFFNL
jgi:cytochrome P450